MRTHSITGISATLIALAIGTSIAAAQKAPSQMPLTEAGRKLETRYTGQLESLRAELVATIPQTDQAKGDSLNEFLSSDALDARLATFVVLREATARGLAEFSQQGTGQMALIEKLLAGADLMKQMLVADGANAKRVGRNGYGPAQYGPAMQILADIQKASAKAKTGILQRLALAISLEHADLGIP